MEADMFPRFYGYMKDYRKYGLFSCACVALEVMFELVIPLVMADIIDVGVANETGVTLSRRESRCAYWRLWRWGLSRIFQIRGAVQPGAGSGAQEGGVSEDPELFFFQYRSFYHFLLVTRLTSDVTVIQNAVTTGLRPVVRAPVMMVTALCLSFSINARLALIFLVAAPLLGIILFTIISHVRPLYSRMQRSVDLVNRIVQENLTAVRRSRRMSGKAMRWKNLMQSTRNCRRCRRERSAWPV